MSEDPNPELREQPEEPDLREQPGPEFIRPNITPPPRRRDKTFYLALALAAFCIIGAFSAASFLAGFVTGSLINGVQSGSAAFVGGGQFVTKQQMIMQQRGPWMKRPPQGIAAKVAILRGDNGPQFSQPVLKMPAGAGIMVFNQTNQTQVLLPTSGGPRVALPPNQAFTMFIGGPRVIVWQLASNPATTLTIYVIGRP